MSIRNGHLEGRESGIAARRKTANLGQFPPKSLGQHCPTHCPTQPGPSGGQPAASGVATRLGPPIDIRQVAALIGCSPWSVRNTWIPRGLPHLRSGASGKLHFYTDQVVRWIEQRQGGKRV